MKPRLKPSFFIIGERKCGTSSLYRYLLDHPRVLPGRRKELQFFTKGRAHVLANFDGYLENFPYRDGEGRVSLDWPELDSEGSLYEERIEYERQPGESYRTGEASADTFCNGDPALLKELLPDLRLVVLLRDPVERAFSHHRMYRRFQDEGRDLAFVVGDFASDMRTEMASIERGDPAPCLSPSLYLAPLQKWSHLWGEQLQVVFSSQLADPASHGQVMATVLEHLQLPPHEYTLQARYNQAPTAIMPAEIRAPLRAYFAPRDRALEAFLGRKLPW